MKERKEGGGLIRSNRILDMNLTPIRRFHIITVKEYVNNCNIVEKYGHRSN